MTNCLCQTANLTICYSNVTWDKSAVVAVQVGVSLWCVENGGVTIARNLLKRKKRKLKQSLRNHLNLIICDITETVQIDFTCVCSFTSIISRTKVLDLKSENVFGK